MSGSKDHQLQAIAQILPEGVEVRQMLDWWAAADVRYWGGRLRPCWLTAGIEPYGKCIGSFSPSTRTINVIPSFWQRGAEQVARGVLIHEACHQAQGELYRHLDAASGPRGRWTDTSHRCPSWTRAVEDVIQVDGLGVFCPIWRRSTGNEWFPWVPASADWMTWRRVDPDDTFDGRRLLGFREARSFTPGVSQEALQAAAGFVDGGGQPVEPDL